MQVFHFSKDFITKVHIEIAYDRIKNIMKKMVDDEINLLSKSNDCINYNKYYWLIGNDIAYIVSKYFDGIKELEHIFGIKIIHNTIWCSNNPFSIQLVNYFNNHSDDKFDALRYSYIDMDFNKTLHNKELDVPEELIKLKTKLNEIYGTNCFKEKENEIMPPKNINAGTLYINGMPLGRMYPEIKNVIFSGPCTIVMWSDGDKTIVRCDDENFDKEKGLAMAIAKKFLGTNKTKSNYNDIFKKWCTEDEFSEEENKVIEAALEGIKKEIDNNTKKKIKVELETK